ncbi:Secreted effector protein pipB2 [Gemmata obscuriglobus]|nr:pentapeptide repeat-containing protein [Gemmata obscuriglobus]QEG32165.1 Secreted effector protein pipB2 [Gemmata obscuriglobus]VTS11518.1 Uncharacterized protein OS=Cystobacter violaceus Cb vi76 GN=Q664_20155 PE=4 SV=1: Pentapeptide_4: Pentapeptide: Pentapeptide: Pentapeptide_4 [Gemmata obscuriglobus UQM 2246]
MAKAAKAAKAKAPTGKLAGQKVALVGKFWSQQTELEQAIKDEGGTLVDGEQAAPDIVVQGAGTRGKPPAAVAKIQKQHPSVRVLDAAGFYQLVLPTADEFLAILKGPRRDHQFWSRMQSRLSVSGATLDLAGTDFRTIELAEATLYRITLDGSDFRNCSLSNVSFDKIKGAKFDGARFTEGSFSDAENCSLKNVKMDGVRWNPAEFVRCDFSGATLKIRTGSFTRATDCTFKKTDLSGAELEQSHFGGCDFTGADLSHAKLQKTDFTAANLAGATCVDADLRGTNFTNADLRKANFRGANLAGADLTGANVAGADFTGANLTGAKVDGLDASKAKGFVHKPPRAVGPNMLELAKAAKQSKQLTASIELGLTGTEHVELHASLRSYGTHQYPGGGYMHYQPERRHTFSSSVDAPTFEQGMLNLVDLWSKGAPRLGSIKVESKKCPLKPKELLALARAAWCEALEVPIPSADEWARQEQAQTAAGDKVREQMLTDLRGGKAGVARFNARTDKEREALGSLRDTDLSNEKLAGARLNNLDLRGAKFDGAMLSEASFSGSQIQGASFADVPARKANFASARAADAVFRGAILANANLRAATFLRTNFQNVDLTGADFAFSDLRGADFTGATLKNASFSQAKFDADTKFPKGLTAPEGANWVGEGPHPGKVVPAVALAVAGSLDFDTFLKELPRKVDPSRIEKAADMLKAERFQLFADVTDTHLVGVVKSQSYSDLVYSCRLASDGTFCCGTQNLNVCGGLKGALCKHLLVLVVGLAKSGKLDPAAADNWVTASKAHKPTLNKDALSETFLKYKGAEAGEIDWRPTETVPEDFYAM